MTALEAPPQPSLPYQWVVDTNVYEIEGLTSTDRLYVAVDSDPLGVAGDATGDFAVINFTIAKIRP